jgi:hypothetical protein
MKRYSGNRDPRFVAIHRGGDLDLATHRLLVAWAADCAEHVLPLFTKSIRVTLAPVKRLHGLTRSMSDLKAFV